MSRRGRQSFAGYWCCVGWIAAFTLQLIPVEAAEAPPDPPYVRTPPNGSQWSMTIRHDDSSASKENPGRAVRPERLVVKIGRQGVQRGVVSYSDGTSSEFYGAGGLVLSPARNTGRILIREGVSSSPFSLEVSGFPGTGWLNAKSYQGSEERDDEALLRFKTINRVYGDQELAETFVALIEANSRYPKSVELPGSTYEFSPVESYSGDVQLPNDYRAALEAWLKQRPGRAVSSQESPERKSN